MPKQRSTNLSVFKGREAKLNHAIFQTLALMGPQTIYDLYKKLRAQKAFENIKYASVNKRVKSLEREAYVKKAGSKRTKAGFEAIKYEIVVKTYLALLLTFVTMDDLLNIMNENLTLEILAAISFSVSLKFL